MDTSGIENIRHNRRKIQELKGTLVLYVQYISVNQLTGSNAEIKWGKGGKIVFSPHTILYISIGGD